MSEEITSVQAWARAARSLFTCPSGAVVELRRIDRETLIMCGRLPQVLVEKVMRAYAEIEQLPATEAGAASVKQSSVLPTIIDAYLIAGVSKPKVVLSNADEAKGQVNVHDIPDEDRRAIFAELSAGSPSVPVATETGEVTLAALAEFRTDRQREPATTSSNDSPDIRREVIELVRASV